MAVGRDVAQDLPALRAAGLRVLAADGHADVDLDARRRRGAARRPDGLGVRQRGLGPARRRPAALADAVVQVPIHGRAESLNLATAAAVCLYASARAQRAQADDGPDLARREPPTVSSVNGSATSSVAVPPSLGLAVRVPSKSPVTRQRPTDGGRKADGAAAARRPAGW